MIIKETLGQLETFDCANRTIDRLPLEWFETGKRILHKRTHSGTEIILKFLGEAPALQKDDVVYADEITLIVIDIIACEVIVIQPTTMYQMALACYEIGNKHLPLFYEDDLLLIPFDAPVFRMLQALHFNVEKETKKLLHPLKTSVAPHAHRGAESLFSRILKLTTTPDA